jgi:hypothetical protein
LKNHYRGVPPVSLPLSAPDLLVSTPFPCGCHAPHARCAIKALSGRTVSASRSPPPHPDSRSHLLARRRCLDAPCPRPNRHSPTLTVARLTPHAAAVRSRAPPLSEPRAVAARPRSASTGKGFCAVLFTTPSAAVLAPSGTAHFFAVYPCASCHRLHSRAQPCRLFPRR